MTAKRIPVIIDTDPGVDDLVAILLAIASPELEILAYISSYGNSDVNSSRLNIIKAYQAIHLHLEQFPSDKDRFKNFGTDKKPILASGAAGPLKGEIHYAQYFHGRDGLGDITERHPELAPSPGFDVSQYLEISTKPGIDVTTEILRSYPPRSVTYIALAPLTNLAVLMRNESQLFTSRIGRVISMGGALEVPGNTSPMAEFNYFADPYAVKELLLSGNTGFPRERFIMLPLDITTPHELPFPVYKEFVDPTFFNTSQPSIASNKSPLVHFTSSFLERTRELMVQFGKDAMELHDVVTIWCAIHHPPFPDHQTMTFGDGWKAHARIFDIERTGELTRGMLVVDRREDLSAYPLGAIRSETQREPHKTNGGTKFDKFDKVDAVTCMGLSIRSEAQRDPHEVNGDSKFDRSDKLDAVTSMGLGVVCMYETPGPAKLLTFLLKRVWGCTGPCL